MPWVQSWTHDCPTLAWHVSWVQGHTHNCSSRSSTCVMGSKLNPRLLCSEPDMCHESNPGPPNALSGPGMCHGSYMPHDCSALSLSCVMGPIWSMTALTFVTFVTFTWALRLPWIIYAPWLLCTEPVMCHGSYMIHDCSTRSLTFLMDHMWSMNALHGALHIPWILYDPWLLFTEPLLMLLSP